jgi:Tol biopolymer transport system component/serine/threonine protein kinase
MSLKPGRRLGPYEIQSPLGAGGMGEVYRARDTRLGREVAIKVLPAHLAESPQRRERFEREARAVSALSHPHICALYDVGETDGLSYIVMEHLEGESLAHRLKAGPLPVEQVVRIGTEIADALDRAHRAGIVHRDLKPGNVMLTRSGAKLLDFGLAKGKVDSEAPSETSAPTGVKPPDSQLPTDLKPPDSSAPTDPKEPLTEAGTVLGTFQYMAPEQLEGQEADGRADIWALGCLLFEMAAGRPPFAGKSQASLISSIMRDVPPPLAVRPPLASGSLEHVVRKCLEKDREDRWQSAHDLADELRWITSGTARPGRSRTPRDRRWVAWSLAALAIAGAGATGFAVGRLRAKVAEGGGEGRVAQQLTFQRGVERHPALSPDGSLVAYESEASGDADIYLQRVEGRNAIDLTRDSPAADTEPSFSPDGSQIAFRSERGQGGIFVMGATGESVRRLSDVGHNPTWSPDGTHIVVATESVVDPLSRVATSELWTIDVASGEKRRLFAGDAVQPAWSPDGRRIAFWRVQDNSGQRDLATLAADGSGEPVALTDDPAVDWSPAWSPDGRELYFVSDRAGTMDVWRIGVDERTGRARGAPVRVGAPAEEVAWLSVARRGGQIAYSSRSALHYLQALSFDPQRLRPTASPTSLYVGSLPLRDPHPSPDGSRIALTTSGSREDLYVLQRDDGELRQLTNDPARDRGPQWSPDGSEIAFYSNRSGTYQLWSIRPDGSGLRPLTSLAEGAWDPYWSPDGTRIAFPTGKATGTCVIKVADAPASSAECLPDLSKETWFHVRDWSPDGRWLVGSPTRHGGGFLPGLVLWSFETREYRPLEKQGFVARWLPDSRHLLILDDRGELAVVDRDTGTSRSVSPLDVPGTLDRQRLGLARDGRTAVFLSDSLESNVWLLGRRTPGPGTK